MPMQRHALLEKRIKRWNWAWKIRLIEAENSGWNDLSARLGG
jgi:putative endonuclease